MHLRDQPGILSTQICSHRTGSPSIPYLILLRGGFSVRPSFQMGRWALTPPFHHHKARTPRCLFSVALSITSAFPMSPVFDKRVLRPVESGLSSAPKGSDRSHARRFRGYFQRALSDTIENAAAHRARNHGLILAGRTVPRIRIG